MEYAIETRKLVKRYPTKRSSSMGYGRGRGIPSFSALINLIRGSSGAYIEALKGIDLQIKPGEIFGILGPNGAGKSTLIKILCTLVLHDGGEVYVNGYDPSKEPSNVLKNLQAVLPESRGFSWRLSGKQNLEFYALLYGLDDTESKKRIDYLLELTELKERAEDGYQRYSTGMQRRLLLCRALIRDTPIIIFDEPTTGLDPTGAADFRDLLKNKLAYQEKKTILLSTHNLQEAQEICDRIAILDKGKILACDTPDNVRHLVIEEREIKIDILPIFPDKKYDLLVKQLNEFSYVTDIQPETNQNGRIFRINIRLKKEQEITEILKVISENELKIKSVNTQEPTLEEAFIQMTRQAKKKVIKEEETGK
ncbi:ABC transporter ATP-binding protein [Candidatus Bathyarchaeota archaeon]|nr:ABC transporter ATP-binding protein [Candidatus Bathyarchaeota archaeon]